MGKPSKQIIVVTGLSGAGMSSALKNLEDIGYEVFDNFPLTMIDPLLNDSCKTNAPTAIGIDSRTRGFSPENILTTVKKLNASLLFLTADEQILQNRFTATRRRHPLAKDRPINDGIKKEQTLLYSLKSSASLIVDTSDLSIHDLRRILFGHFRIGNEGKMTIALLSFGFRWGLPREADIVMDIRFLQNPYWITALRPLSGKETAVATYIESDESLTPFLNNFKAMIKPLLPRYVHEGKSYLTLAFGCSGGRHRSVFITEHLKPWLESQGFVSHIFHRDIEH